MIKIMNGKPVIVDEDGKTRVLFDNLPGDIGGTPGYDELLEDVQNLMDYVYGTDLYTENKTPYFLRASGGGVEVGICENDTLVGGSVGWNQYIENGNFSTKSWWSENIIQYTVANNEATFSASQSAAGIYKVLSLTPGHKYFYVMDINTTGQLSVGSVHFGGRITVSSGYGSYQTVGGIGSATQDSVTFVIYTASNSATTVKVRNVMVIDLTLLLGSTIADRLYTLEQSTAGSGIAQLKAWGFDFSEYIPYTAPTLKHVEGVSEHRFVGFNQVDVDDPNNTSAYIDNTGVIHSNVGWTTSSKVRVVSGCPYTLEGLTAHPNSGTDNYRLYDSAENYIGVLSKAIDRYPVTFNDEVAYVQFCWKTDEKDLVCFHLVGGESRNGEYEPYRTWSYALDGDVTLRGVPKLDASNQLYYEGDTYEPDGTVTRNCAVRAYQSGDESLADAITDGTNTVYKLSTPTTETATPFAEYQEVDPNGTEEYVSTGVVPVGHVTKYPTDLKGKLEQILEGVPTTDGTYVLTATVSSGKATYSWESTSSAKTSVKEPIDTLEKEIVEKPFEEEPVDEEQEEEQPVEEITEEPVDEEQEEEQPVEETDE